MYCAERSTPSVVAVEAATTKVTAAPGATPPVWYPPARTGGGHAMSLIGYDPATDLWKFRNQWGPTFGWNGDGFITSASLQTVTQAMYVETY